MEFTLKEPLFALLISFAISSCITPLFRMIALKLRILDKPNQAHKSHTHPIPYLGGASIVTTCLIVYMFAILTNKEVFSSHSGLFVLLVAPVLLSIVGLFDDIRGLSVGTRFSVQSITATLVAFIFYSNNIFGAPSGILFLDLFVTTFWIVGLTNAINLLDNLDGGAGGVLIIAFIFLGSHAILGGQYFLGTLASILAGATFGFLVWNLYPARIYLGDSGSLFLGSIISILIVRLDTDSPSALSSWVIALSLVAVPILDTTVVVISRYRRGVSPFLGAQDHISHRLLNYGFTRRQAALTIWSLALYFCLLGAFLGIATNIQTTVLILIFALSWISLAFIFLRYLNIEKSTIS